MAPLSLYEIASTPRDKLVLLYGATIDKLVKAFMSVNVANAACYDKNAKVSVQGRPEFGWLVQAAGVCRHRGWYMRASVPMFPSILAVVVIFACPLPTLPPRSSSHAPHSNN